MLPLAALTLKIRRVADFVREGDRLFDQALLQDGDATTTEPA
jgi:hypothetical protein